MSGVRLDKYLKVSRVIKRRTLAQELCLGGHVKKNDRTAKPSTDVEVGGGGLVVRAPYFVLLQKIKNTATPGQK